MLNENKFVDMLNNSERCLVCVENIGHNDVEYNTFDVDGAWEDEGGLKLSFNNGKTEIYLRDWDEINVLLSDDNGVNENNKNDISDGEDGTNVFEFVFGNVRRKFVFI